MSRSSPTCTTAQYSMWQINLEWSEQNSRCLKINFVDVKAENASLALVLDQADEQGAGSPHWLTENPKTLRWVTAGSEMVSLIAELEERDQSFPSSFTIFSQLRDIVLHTTWYTDWRLFYIVSCSIVYFLSDQIGFTNWRGGQGELLIILWHGQVRHQPFNHLAVLWHGQVWHQPFSRTLCALSYNYIQIIVAFTTSVCQLSVCFKCDPNTN